MKKILLVVDDEPDIVAILKSRLEANNYIVISASGGEEGIKKAQQNKPDLILMDILMPNMSGGEVVMALRADEQTKHIPVLFLTAIQSNISRGEEDKGVKVGGQFYPAMGKPFEPDKLLSEIKKLMVDK